jgi:hypothetical protein
MLAPPLEGYQPINTHGACNRRVAPPIKQATRHYISPRHLGDYGSYTGHLVSNAIGSQR